MGFLQALISGNLKKALRSLMPPKEKANDFYRRTRLEFWGAAGEFLIAAGIVEEAEAQFPGSGTGAEKKAWVMDKLGDALENLAEDVSAEVREELIDRLIEFVVVLRNNGVRVVATIN